MNVMPLQLLGDGTTILDFDNKYSKRSDLEKIVSKYTNGKVEFFTFFKGQKILTGVFHGDKDVYIILANITFMGGKEGQHPLDLKRIQFNYRWKDFYYKFKDKGIVLWMGLYSYKGNDIFASFSPETYLQDKSENSWKTRSGSDAQFSCHIFLNDLYQGKIDSYFSKIDKGKNIITTISPNFLVRFFKGEKITNPIIETIKQFNGDFNNWNKWIYANEAIPFMYGLYDKDDKYSFKQWKQTKWNGWYIEALYYQFINNNNIKEISYLATERNEHIKSLYTCGLDLAFPNQMFVGDLKAIGIDDDGKTLLNDEKAVNNALDKYKRIWFVMYLHHTNPAKTNNYEMVKWRNNYISTIENKPVDNELSGRNTPHSVEFVGMTVIELNSITKNKYFEIGKQYGVNSDGKERNNKYKIKKSLLSELDDDSFVIYREIY